jgi:hypothetical protein
MKPTRKSMLFVSSLLLALAAFSAMPTPAHAADAQGTLTLPMQASWNGVMLPAGTYEYSVEYNGSSTLVTIRNKETMSSTLLIARCVSEKIPTTSPSLTLTREGNSAFVATLNLGDTVLSFDTQMPKAGMMLARSNITAGNGTGPAAPVK